MKDKKLRKRQAEGLLLIRDGMQVQLNQYKWRQGNDNDVNNPQTAVYNTAIKMLEYWIAEADKALNGELHF